MERTFIIRWRTLLLALVYLGCFGVVLGRLYYLHVVQGDELANVARENRENFVVEKARRGNILDSAGNLLATTHVVVELGLDPQVATADDAEKWPELARLAKISVADIEAAVRQKTFEKTNSDEFAEKVRLVRWRKLAEGLDERTYERIKELDIAGVYGNLKYERYYPSGPLAAHVVGFTNREGTPVMGVENTMDFYLRGQDGWREIERDGARRELASFEKRSVQPSAGMNIELTIDQVIQHFVEDELARIVADHAPMSASIIVSEPSTGDILALGNYPNFDPNTFNKAPISHHRNRAVTDVFEPGSTFKIVCAAAAIEEGLVKRETLFDTSQRVVSYKGRMVKLPKDHKDYGELTFEDVIAKSSNQGAAQLGMLLGEQRLLDYCKAFGFGDKTGFELGGEVGGILHELNRWDGLTISRLPMGHAVSATAMQVHMSMSVLANRGILMKPRVISRVFDDAGDTVTYYQPRAERRVISETTSREMSDLLVRTAAPGGTAPRAQIPTYQVAGKTGTTQKIIEGRYSSSQHVASFSGYFPANNPRLVITVIVDDPARPKPGYGGVVAAPAFRNIAMRAIQYLGLDPVSPEDLESRPRFYAHRF